MSTIEVSCLYLLHWLQILDRGRRVALLTAETGLIKGKLK